MPHPSINLFQRPLSRLLEQFGPFKKVGGGDPAITGINSDSRLVNPGQVFVAVKGEHHDGHNFIPEAVKKGAAALVVGEEAAIRKADPPVVQVENSRRALAHLASAFFDHPARKLTCAGVTGTTGKTTTTFLLNAIWEEAGLSTGLVGTLYQKVHHRVFPSTTTTPVPEELYPLLAEMVREGVSHVAMEVSSHSLCQERVAAIPFAAGIFTNLSPEHLNYHKTLSHYLASKAKLFYGLPPDSFAILNLEDPASTFIQQQTAAQILTYGTSPEADLQALGIRTRDRGTSFSLRLNRTLVSRQGRVLSPQQWPVTLPLLGGHNVLNALGAAGAALCLGIEPEVVCRALGEFSGVPRRLQVVYRGPFTIIDDFAHNRGSLEAVFKTIASMDYRKLVIVNYLKGSRGVRANEITARCIAAASKGLQLARVISTRSDSHVSPKNIVQDEEERAFTRIIKGAGIPITNTRELPTAIHLGLNSLAPGDILLLLGPSGMDEGATLAHQFLLEEPQYQERLPAAAAAQS